MEQEQRRQNIDVCVLVGGRTLAPIEPHRPTDREIKKYDDGALIYY